jgi:solute carrier family 36 (proton-coupled amino acid transporter)
MIVGILLTLGYAFQNLPSFSERNYIGSLESLPLTFGTILFTYEAIALVLPLQNEMRKPENFSKRLGVLNVGMVIATAMYIIIGVVGYWKYGEEVLGSVTLNLPNEDM